MVLRYFRSDTIFVENHKTGIMNIKPFKNLVFLSMLFLISACGNKEGRERENTDFGTNSQPKDGKKPYLWEMEESVSCLTGSQ